MKSEIISFNEMKKRILKYNPNANIDLIKKAYYFSKKAHEGQKRESGEPYFTHPAAIAAILIELKAVSETICGALLHDVVEETRYTLNDIKKEFGDEIANLVEGTTKIDKINFDTKEDYTAENLRKVLLATSKDIRVMLIKLVDRLHNMRTLKYFRPEKQKRIAAETLEIFAPIAHKLGIWNIKGELEDLSLRFLKPNIYNMLRKRINEKRTEREKNTEDIIRTIENELKRKNIKARVYGRAKYFYSIYKKMIKKNVDFNEIYDLIGIRIITENIPDCYAALGIVHELWKPLPKHFKDYISTPKLNGYQSLHTAVIGNHGKILEVQIRTEEMHNIAEYGVAAHWRYQGTERDKKFDKKIDWLKQILDWRMTSSDARDFIEYFKIDIFEKEIIVFTPKGDPISLPENATPIDFAYEVHSSIGNACSKALVNTKLVSLDTTLKAGDVVEIMTKKGGVPSRQWLRFVKTSKAKNKIRSVLGITAEQEKSDKNKSKTEHTHENMIEVNGKKAQIKLSKCCNPQYNDPIVGFYTKDKKITVHKTTCINTFTLDSARQADIKWKSREKMEFQQIKIIAEDRVGLLAEALNIISSYKINLGSINGDSEKDMLVTTIQLMTGDSEKTNEIINRLKGVKGIKKVSTL
ncbi:bifunctional (p)ppGpp synthetase/guanosine-3',5'-bis(diphosphate) 3'-pyrophosphohydrolase [Candidatus Woesearchaeota archaeon]|nr:bifunctional (p)ppGpp synthetase/guanosine-3',5'-bis(diphosphate) 3'-pyrophosphohydrolase [Candidatus Woesearchaeota archaeon]